jgi:hypothetical protein
MNTFGDMKQIDIILFELPHQSKYWWHFHGTGLPTNFAKSLEGSGRYQGTLTKGEKELYS